MGPAEPRPRRAGRSLGPAAEWQAGLAQPTLEALPALEVEVAAVLRRLAPAGPSAAAAIAPPRRVAREGRPADRAHRAAPTRWEDPEENRRRSSDCCSAWASRSGFAGVRGRAVPVGQRLTVRPRCRDSKRKSTRVRLHQRRRKEAPSRRLRAQVPSTPQKPLQGSLKGLRSRVLFGARHLWYVVKEFMARHPADRRHQVLRGQLSEKPVGSASERGRDETGGCVSLDDEASAIAGGRIR